MKKLLLSTFSFLVIASNFATAQVVSNNTPQIAIVRDTVSPGQMQASKDTVSPTQISTSTIADNASKANESTINSMINTDAGRGKTKEAVSGLVGGKFRKDTTKVCNSGGSFSINASQTTLDNWSGGGSNSFSAVSALNVYADYLKKKNSWNNSLNVQYGYLNASSNKIGGRKNVDLIDFVSMYGYQFSPKVDFSTLGRVRTQLSKNYVYKKDDDGVERKAGYTSRFFAPAYVTVAPGINYRPVKELTIFLSPVAVRGLFVMDDSLSRAGAFGVTPGKKFDFQFGAYANLTAKVNITKNIFYAGNMELYSNYLHNPQNIYMFMTNTLSAKITKYIAFNINYNLAYDDLYRPVEGKGPRLQTQSIYGLGVMLNF